MSVYGRVEEVHQENREPLEYQIEQESHHRESSRLPLVKILLWSTLVTGITLGVPLLLDLMSAQEVQRSEERRVGKECRLRWVAEG